MIDRLKSTLHYPYARARMGVLSELARLRSIGRRPVVWWEAPYDGRKVMLLALYEKGSLRPDVIRLLRAARAANLYILAVNTLKLSHPQSIRDLADCYIERPNFGRDFGSYQTGFLHLYARGWDGTCPRLLLLNDSIYFNEARLPRFIEEMMNSDVEALGSTENFEFDHHLGSFCIAVGNPVLRHPRFHRFWKRYKLSDIRPTVIQRGEMGLTKALKQCVSSASQFQALYGASRFVEELHSDPELLEFAVQNSRRCDVAAWKRATPVSLVNYVNSRFTVPTYELNGQEVKVDVPQGVLPDARTWVGSVDDVARFVRSKLTDASDLDPSTLRKAVAGHVSEMFMAGSQIHLNAIVLLKMGLPIIKLDLIYRGLFNVEDLNLTCEQINKTEASELRALLIARPFGGHMFRGWKLAAFGGGLI